jgi:hypothetical protein
VNGEQFQVYPGAPLFFLSYALPGAPRNSPSPPHELAGNVLRLFDDLSTDVNELVGRAVGADPGFMDRIMGGGRRWTPELLRAAGTCQVFVPLISPTMVGSEWCAMEWDAFSRRTILNRQRGKPANETGIVPLTWSHTEPDELPGVMSKIQRFYPGRLPNADVAALYQEEGVYGMLRLGHEQGYRAVVWRLAQRVVEIHRSHWVAPRIPSSADELRNVFLREGEG